MFIPGIFCGEACGLGEADGIGIFCMCGLGDGVGDAAGISIPGIFCIWGVGEGDAFGAGVGDGIGIPCLCCAGEKDGQNRMRARAVHQTLRLIILISNLGNCCWGLGATCKCCRAQ